MRNWIRLVVTLAFVGVTAGVRAGADQQAPPKPAPKAERPSPEGTYAVEGGTAEVRVKRISGDFLHVSSSDGWEGVGVLDGPIYRGVFRDRAVPDAPPPALGDMTIDWTRADNPETKATYTVRARSQFAQRWRRSDVLIVPREEPPPPPPAPGRRPAFGDYVYVEELPEALTKVPPAYPDEARRSRVQGVVMVQALVIEDGSVADCKIVSSIPLLDEAAIASVRQWRFKPAKTAGKPVAVWVAVPVRFSLQ